LYVDRNDNGWRYLTNVWHRSLIALRGEGQQQQQQRAACYRRRTKCSVYTHAPSEPTTWLNKAVSAGAAMMIHKQLHHWVKTYEHGKNKKLSYRLETGRQQCIFYRRNNLRLRPSCPKPTSDDSANLLRTQQKSSACSLTELPLSSDVSFLENPHKPHIVRNYCQAADDSGRWWVYPYQFSRKYVRKSHGRTPDNRRENRI